MKKDSGQGYFQGYSRKHITHIWFTTPLSLQEIAAILKMSGTSCDEENYWAWVTGKYAYQTVNVALDITRAHLYPPEETETIIFVYEGRKRHFSDAMGRHIAVQLKEQGISPVYLGQRHYQQGNEFSFHVLDTIV